MEVLYKKSFKKQFKKLPKNTQKQFENKLIILLDDSFAPELNNHTLHGKYSSFRSINISGNIRAIYTTHKNMIIFSLIGSHSELYE